MYFSINFSTDKNVAGIYPQLELKSGIYKNGQTPGFKSVTPTEPISEELNMDDFVFSKKAIRTDILSSNEIGKECGLFLSPKAYNVFYVNRNEYSFFKEIVINDETIYFMQILKGFDLIDYNQSVFIDKLDPNSGDEKIDSYGSFLERSKETFIKPIKIVLTHTPTIFRLPFDTSILITERFKIELEKISLSGMEIKPYTYIEIS